MTGPADAVQFRAPRDGARIEIVAVTTALYFYRADINTWTPAYGLTLDMESPLNARHNRAFSTMLAGGMSTWFPQAQLPPLMMARIGRARASIFTQAGTSRDPVRADYL